jgi:hypothetical protein
MYSTLLLSIVIAYTPQVTKIISHRSSQGLSPLFLLFGALCCNLQLTNTLLLVSHAWPNDRERVLDLIHSRKLKGFKAFGAVLGLIQAALQWACSVSLYVFTLITSLPLLGS